MSKRVVPWVVAAVAGLLAIVSLARQRDAANSAAERDLIALHRGISIGAAAPEVRGLIQGGETELSLAEVSESRWVVATPTQFGARNLQLFVELSGGRVTSVRCRELDAPDFRPPRCPPDTT